MVGSAVGRTVGMKVGPSVLGDEVVGIGTGTFVGTGLGCIVGSPGVIVGMDVGRRVGP